MNAPPRFESFMLYEGEKKIEVKKEVNVSDAALFTLNREDHTLGNILKTQLLRDPKVRAFHYYISQGGTGCYFWRNDSWAISYGLYHKGLMIIRIFRFYLQVIRILIHLKTKLWSEFKLLLITHHRKLSQMPLLIFYLVRFVLTSFRSDGRNPDNNVSELSLLEERFRQQLKEHSEGNNYD